MTSRFEFSTENDGETPVKHRRGTSEKNAGRHACAPLCGESTTLVISLIRLTVAFFLLDGPISSSETEREIFVLESTV